jgi:hypothetical protein
MTRIQKLNGALSWSQYQLNMTYVVMRCHTIYYIEQYQTSQQSAYRCVHTSLWEIILTNITTIDAYSRHLLFGGIVNNMQLLSVKRVQRCTINIKWQQIVHIIMKYRLNDINLWSNTHQCRSRIVRLFTYKRQPIDREMFILCDMTKQLQQWQTNNSRHVKHTTLTILLWFSYSLYCQSNTIDVSTMVFMSSAIAFSCSTVVISSNFLSLFDEHDGKAMDDGRWRCGWRWM